MVNQKLALQDGYQPCSTIKVVVSLAGLSEGLIERNTHLRLYGRTSIGLTQALAHSNNMYFASVGQKLGFERVSYYARLFGLGEKAGYDIPGEHAGVLTETPPASGVGMMTSFGDGISLTPLELASIMSTVANGGTMYYLQYPRSKEEIEHFTPRVKRNLDIEQWVPEIKPGMMGAVEYGTARRAAYDPNEPILGKTGTCTDTRTPTHLGWFGSFNEVGRHKLVVVVLLTGGRGVSGPIASGIAGQVYRNLSKVNYFQDNRITAPVALINTSFRSIIAIAPARALVRPAQIPHQPSSPEERQCPAPLLPISLRTAAPLPSIYVPMRRLERAPVQRPSSWLPESSVWPRDLR